MHGELNTPKGQPKISAAVIPIHSDKGEMESLLYPDKGEMESLLYPEKGEHTYLLHHDMHHQQEARYYQNVPEVAVNFTIPPSAPPPQYDSHNWRPTVKKQEVVDKANWFGIFLAFMSGAFFTLASASVKALKSIDPMELLIIRTTLQCCVMLPIALKRGENIFGPKGTRWLLQLQGMVGGWTLVLLFFTFRRLPLGDATTIIFSSPVFVMIMSFLFLKEPCGFFRTLIVFLLLTGVVLISKPPFIFQTFGHEYDVFGYICALGATLFTALNIVVMRKCKDVHFSVVVLQLSLWGLMTSGAVLLIFGHQHHDKVFVPPHGLREWGLAVLVSVLGLSGQVLVAKALGMEGAGRVAVTRSLDIVLAFVLQVLAFGEIPDFMSITGALLVLTCVMGMGMEEHILYLASLVP